MVVALKKIRVPNKVSWWGIGDESWGCGGTMTPEYYAEVYKRYATFANDYPGTTLNIFNNHADRVRGANLAQTVNVLQTPVLTDKEKMLLTPTYHVFDLYQVHQDAEYLPLQFVSPDYVPNGESRAYF